TCSPVAGPSPTRQAVPFPGDSSQTGWGAVVYGYGSPYPYPAFGYPGSSYTYSGYSYPSYASWSGYPGLGYPGLGYPGFGCLGYGYGSLGPGSWSDVGSGYTWPPSSGTGSPGR